MGALDSRSRGQEGGRSMQSPQESCSTHWMDDALQGLKAVIYRKPWSLLCNQMARDMANYKHTHGDVLGSVSWRAGKSHWVRGSISLGHAGAGRACLGSRRPHCRPQSCQSPWPPFWAGQEDWLQLLRLFNACLLGSRGKLSIAEDGSWPGVDVFGFGGWPLALSSHSTTFLLATVFESNRLRFPFRATLKINSSFGVGWGHDGTHISRPKLAHWGRILKTFGLAAPAW